MRTGKLQQAVLATLSTAERPLRAAEIADIVYADQEDGGPLSATETVWSTVRNLKRAGHPIARGRAGYVMQVPA